MDTVLNSVARDMQDSGLFIEHIGEVVCSCHVALKHEVLLGFFEHLLDSLDFISER